MMHLTSSCDDEGRMVSISIHNGKEEVIRAEYLGDEMTFNSATIPTALFRRFIRASLALLNDHHQPVPGGYVGGRSLSHRSPVRLVPGDQERGEK